MKRMKAYKFKLLPTKKQEKIFSNWFGGCRFLYNCALEHRVISWNYYKKSISYYNQQNDLPSIKKMHEFEWMKAIPSQSLQYSLRKLDGAFDRFFKGLGGFPKYKKRGFGDSIHFPTGSRLFIEEVSKKKCTVELPKIGKVKFRSHRKIEGKIKNATVKRDENVLTISFCTEYEDETFFDSTKPSIGIDKGIIHTLAISDGNFLDLPVKKIKKLEKKIEVQQRRLSKAVKFSKRWKEIKKIIGKIHRKITRIRHNFLHVQTHYLAKNHGLVAVEDLKVKNMSKSSKGTLESPGKNVSQKSGLNRSILRQGWGIFQDLLEYKCSIFGAQMIKVNPKNTSSMCSNCGNVSSENRETQARYVCKNCNYEDNADLNAARNILRLGLQSLGSHP